jgi:hypothetical protein
LQLTAAQIENLEAGCQAMEGQSQLAEDQVFLLNRVHEYVSDLSPEAMSTDFPFVFPPTWPVSFQSQYIRQTVPAKWGKSVVKLVKTWTVTINTNSEPSTSARLQDMVSGRSSSYAAALNAAIVRAGVKVILREQVE